MSQLKLGPLPKIETLRVTITVPKPLKQALDLYAADYARTFEPVEIKALIPHMLEAFLRSDRAFMQRHARAVRTPPSPAPLPGETITPPAQDHKISSK
jgi:hypothetical protein